MTVQSNARHASQPESPQDRPGKFFKFDFLASIVVFLVALPLCMGVAIASGVDPALGIITGIVGGIIVGLLSGAPLQVSGPAAGLFVIVYQLINTQKQAYIQGQGGLEALDETARAALQAGAMKHALAAMGIAVIICGVLQIVAGGLKLGQWFRAVSPAVVRGMLAGIGVLIFASQFHVMIDDNPSGNGLKDLLTVPQAIYKAFNPDETTTHHLAALTGVITILTLMLWQKLAPRRLAFIPSPLVAVVTASLFALAMNLGVQKINVPESLLAEITFPSTATVWQLLTNPAIITAGIVLAAVASAETLLCTTALDQMHNGQRAQYDREMVAQGVGNLICGFLGSLPMTGVIVRSSANVLAGARTRLSTILHGSWLLLFVVGLPQVMGYIPRSCLGAILVYTGCKLVNVKAIKDLWKFGKGEVVIYAVTLVTIVAADLLTGVLAGIALAAAKLLYTISHLRTELKTTHAGRQAVLKLHGSATFLRLPKLADQLERVPRGTSLHVDFEHLDYIDHACIDLLMNWAKQHESDGGRLTIDWDSLHARFRSESRQKDGEVEGHSGRGPKRARTKAGTETSHPSSEETDEALTH